MAKKQTNSTSHPMTVAKRFDSLSDFAAWINSTPADHWNCRTSESSDKKFSGTENYKESEDLMLYGWDHGKNEVTKIMDRRFDGVQAVKKLALSYVGAVPCIPAYMAGSPKNMITVTRRNIPRPVVSLAYNCAVGSLVTTEQIMTAAAKLFNVIRGLELGGVSVELWACMAAKDMAGKGQYVCSAVKIKTASQPLNVLNMCYPVVHPSFLRRQNLAFIERSGVDQFSGWINYGRPVSDQNKASELIQAAGVECQAVLSYYDICNKTETEIAGMIK